MKRALQRSVQMARKSAQLARQNQNRVQSIRQTNQATMRRTTGIGVHQALKKNTDGSGNKKEGGFFALFGVVITVCWLAGLGFLFGGPVLAVIGGLLGIKLGGKLSSW